MKNRIIKFRAWSKGGLCMLPVGELHFMQGGLVVESLGVHISDPILMQFTGLKDKNGKEIYEGDIVEMGTGQRFAVEWNNSEASFLIAGLQRFIQQLPSGEWFDHSKFCEVIGNIYENPELLKP